MILLTLSRDQTLQLGYNSGMCPANPSTNNIDDLLPQTQCGLCGYGGCQPYAAAIADKTATINLCPPGGVETLIELGDIMGVDPTPYMAEMQAKQKPAMLAVIREDECIGCTKCLQACPVDAIVGTAKYMHTVIASECTGCELCVTPCPVDCIDIINIHSPSVTSKKAKANQARQRYAAHKKRLQNKAHAKTVFYEQAKLQTDSIDKEHIIAARKAAIAEAIARAKAKKGQCS